MAKKLHVNGMFGNGSEGSGLPEGSGANRQLVTDAEGNAVWEERTHYSNTVTYLPLQTIEGEQYSYCYLKDVPINQPLPVEKTVYVTVDGVEYSGMFIPFEFGEYTHAFASSPDASEPFMFHTNTPEGAYNSVGIFTAEGSTSICIMTAYGHRYPFTSKVKIETKEIKPVDPAYLPDTIVRITDLPARKLRAGDVVPLLDKMQFMTWEESWEEDGGIVVQYPAVIDPPMIEFIKGRTYEVTYDGQVYTCVAHSDSHGLVYIGNYDIAEPSIEDFDLVEGDGEDIREPFYYSCYHVENTDDHYHSLVVNTPGMHTIAVGYVCPEDEVIQLPVEFIPDTIARKEDLPGDVLKVLIYYSDSSYHMYNVTYSEIVAALLDDRRSVKFYVRPDGGDLHEYTLNRYDVTAHTLMLGQTLFSKTDGTVINSMVTISSDNTIIESVVTNDMDT